MEITDEKEKGFRQASTNESLHSYSLRVKCREILFQHIVNQKNISEPRKIGDFQKREELHSNQSAQEERVSFGPTIRPSDLPNQQSEEHFISRVAPIKKGRQQFEDCSTYEPTALKQSYSQFCKEFKAFEASADLLREFNIFRRNNVEVSSSIPLPRVSFGKDWINIQDCFEEESTEPECIDSRLFIDEVSPDFRHAIYIVLIGVFKIKISVMMVQQDAPTVNQTDYFARGGFGSVLKENLAGAIRVKKRIFFMPPESQNYRSKRQLLQNTVRQYAFVKLLACYGYGPGILDPTEYDILCYSNCIEFGMNHCQTFSESLQSLEMSHRSCLEKFTTDIKECLLWMHHYHIVHRDIKPSNCMYNPSTKKFVLIDFGITHPVQESYKDPTFTFACGTINFMTNELRALMSKRDRMGYINLYEADMYAFEMTVARLRKSYRQEKPQYGETLVAQNNALMKLERLLLDPTPTSTAAILECIKSVNAPHIQQTVALLKRITNYNDLLLIYNLCKKHQGEIDPELLSQISKLLHFQTFIDNQMETITRTNTKVGKNIEFEVLLEGCNERIEKIWREQLQQEAETTVYRQAINRQRLLFEAERINFVSYDSPSEIFRESAGIRVSHVYASKAYKSILKCKHRSLSWLRKVKAYIGIIMAQYHLGEAIEKSPYLVKLKRLSQLYESSNNKNQNNLCYLNCILSVWDCPSNSETFKITEQFLEQVGSKQNFWMYPRAFMYAAMVRNRNDLALHFLGIEQKYRIRTSLLGNQESVVMYGCLIEKETRAAKLAQYCNKGLLIFDHLKKQSVETWIILDAYVYMNRGFFLARLNRDIEAIEQLEEVLYFYEYNNINVSWRMAQTKKCLADIYKRKGEYDKSLELWVGIAHSEKCVAGDKSHLTQNGVLQIIDIYYRKGDYQQAINHITGLSQLSEQIKLIHACVLIDTNQLQQAENILIALEPELIPNLEDKRHLVLARCFGRQGYFSRANQELSKIEQTKGPSDIELLLARLEILSLQKMYDETFKEIAITLESLMEENGTDVALRVPFLLLRAERDLHNEQGDFGERDCRQCIRHLAEVDTHPRLGRAYWLMSQALLKLTDLEESEWTKSKAQSIFAHQESWLRHISTSNDHDH